MGNDHKENCDSAKENSKLIEEKKFEKIYQEGGQSILHRFYEDFDKKMNEVGAKYQQKLEQISVENSD